MKKGVFVILAVALATVFLFVNRRHFGNPQYKNCERNTSPQFSHHIADTKDIWMVTPPGGTNPQGDFKAHSYLWLYEGTGPVAVYAPVDMTLSGGAFYKEFGELNYTLRFRVTCEIYLKIDHIKQAVPPIATALPQIPAINDTHDQHLKNEIEFNAGDLIGYVGGKNAHNWDFGVYNSTAGTRENGQCPFDFYPPEMAKFYTDRFIGITGNGPPPTLYCE